MRSTALATCETQDHIHFEGGLKQRRWPLTMVCKTYLCWLHASAHSFQCQHEYQQYIWDDSCTNCLHACYLGAQPEEAPASAACEQRRYTYIPCTGHSLLCSYMGLPKCSVTIADLIMWHLELAIQILVYIAGNVNVSDCRDNLACQLAQHEVSCMVRHISLQHRAETRKASSSLHLKHG